MSGTGAAEARALYLDLLTECLIGRLYEDQALPLFRQDRYLADVREVGMDWPSKAPSMIGARRMTNLRQQCERVIEENVPGDFIETGVWRGGACIMMRGVLKAYGETERTVYAADSFRGLPPPSIDIKADEDLTFHTFPDLAVSVDEVRRNFERYGLLDERVVFLEGFFRNTLPKAPMSRLAVLRLDGDMFESTMDALASLYPKVSDRGAVIIDDYGLIEPCRLAVTQYRAEHSITSPIMDIDGVGVFWIR